jgi:hypothetical protein
MSMVSIRYMIDDVLSAIDFYTTHLGFPLQQMPARHSHRSSATACGSSLAARAVRAAAPCQTVVNLFPVAGTGSISR